MIKLTSWPADEGAPCPPVYVNPAHIVILEPQDHGTLIALEGHGVIRVKEDLDTVRSCLRSNSIVAYRKG